MTEMTLRLPAERAERFRTSARTIAAHVGDSLREALEIGYRQKVLEDDRKREGWRRQEDGARRLLPYIDGFLTSVEAAGPGDLEVRSDRDLVAMTLTDCLLDAGGEVGAAAESADDPEGKALHQAIADVQFWWATRQSVLGGEEVA